ncbi:Chemotaxis protein methyltransferase CheR [hydrothermal vent metagenome]|uniref:protein-glutamate O-methyltransferase n=1 Tax=hydrothermal vent metagenome TaxID=652676 RepID=A0A3B1AHT4_9ZZZZ
MKQPVANRQFMLSPRDYQDFKLFLREVSGIELGDDKEYLVASRLGSLLQKHNLSGLNELMMMLTSGRDNRLRSRVIDAMTTNETSWFRDQAHFRLLDTKIFPESSEQRLRVWSAACSSGQEPYTISMQVQDYRVRNPGMLIGDVEIIATDISPTVLEEARQGVYAGMAASRGLSLELQQRFFVDHPDGLKVRPEIKRRVRFQEFNLTRDFGSLGRFDIIFCRNVLIYFPAAVKYDIIHRMSKILRPGGYLLLGSTESMSSHTETFEIVTAQGGIIYRLKG